MKVSISNQTFILLNETMFGDDTLTVGRLRCQTTSRLTISPSTMALSQFPGAPGN
jgi:hypothetical protein